MSPSKYRRREADCLVWQITDSNLEEVRDSILNHPSTKGKFHAAINESNNQAKLSLHVARGKPLFMMSSGYLVLENGKLWKWPKVLFELAYLSIPDVPPAPPASDRGLP